MAVTFKGAKPGNYGDEIEKKFNALLRQAVLYTDQRLKQESPVDTGRFRASWQIGENAIGVYDAGPVKSVPAPKGINYIPGSEKVGKAYILHNTLPYADKLATGSAGSGSKNQKRYNPNRTVTTWGSPGGGSSIQTQGPGWVEQIAKDSQSWFSSQAGKIQ